MKNKINFQKLKKSEKRNIHLILLLLHNSLLVRNGYYEFIPLRFRLRPYVPESTVSRPINCS